ncbi:MAG: FtsW/RodA/SpoVE family cell cycle protein, partial [Xanthomonadaceae bacterium]|nr:FtsW/RodA/SpoVE family cell cycle protein [Xanthomonadaceae bacterium]
MISIIQVRLRRFLQRVLTRPRIDLPLALGLFALATVGLVTLYSAGDGNLALVGGQAARFVLGGALLLLISRIPPSVLRSWTPWLYVGSSALLVLVALLGEGRGAHRWLNLGVMRFQPSELLKLTMPMMVAWYLHARQLPPRWKDIVVVGLLIALPATLIAKQPDLGTALLVAAAGAFALFLSGMAWWRIGVLLGVLGGMVPVAWHVMHQYQRDRVLTL